MQEPTRWKTALIELVIVFVGITAAFMLENWRNASQDARMADQYMTSFSHDLVLDSTELETIIEANRDKLTMIQSALDSRNNQPWSDDTLVTLLTEMMVTHLFQPTNTTYETAKNSGHMPLLPTYTLRSEISQYYEHFDEVRLKESLYNDYVQTYCVPFVFDYMNLASGDLLPSIREVAPSYISNLVVGYSVLLQQLVTTYEEVYQENTQVQEYLRQVNGS